MLIATPGMVDFIVGPLSVTPTASSEAEKVSHGTPGKGTAGVEAPLKTNLGHVDKLGLADGATSLKAPVSWNWRRKEALAVPAELFGTSYWYSWVQGLAAIAKPLLNMFMTLANRTSCCRTAFWVSTLVSTHFLRLDVSITTNRYLRHLGLAAEMDTATTQSQQQPVVEEIVHVQGGAYRSQCQAIKTTSGDMNLTCAQVRPPYFAANRAAVH